MKSPKYPSILKLLINDKSSWRFLITVVICFSFSISVILSTIGIMDSFEYSFKKGLKKSNGDIVLYNTNGFFEIDQNIKSIFNFATEGKFTPIIETKGFVMSDKVAKGFILRGIESHSYSMTTGLKFLEINEGEIILGKVLASKLSVGVGSKVIISLPTQNTDISAIPTFETFEVAGLIEHGIYEKDSRMGYVSRSTLENILKIKNHEVNIISFNVPEELKKNAVNDIDIIRDFQRDFPKDLDYGFVLKPYWSDYAHAIEAVEIEKVTIVLVLQLIVIISVFNIVAFVFFISETKAKVIFLFQALGASKKRISKMWKKLFFIIWFFSSLLSIVFVKLFNVFLTKLDIFKLPGEIYKISGLFIKLGVKEYIIVFLIAYMWLYLISRVVLIRLNKKSIAMGLRSEFN